MVDLLDPPVWARMNYPYKGTGENDLPLEKDEIVKVIRKYDNGWWVGEKNGKYGVFPASYAVEVPYTPPPVKTPPIETRAAHTPPSSTAVTSSSAGNPNRRSVALDSYLAKNPSQISFKKGDTINIIEEFPTGWSKGEIGGKVGLFPRNLAKVDTTPISSTQTTSNPTASVSPAIVTQSNFQAQSVPTTTTSTTSIASTTSFTSVATTKGLSTPITVQDTSSVVPRTSPDKNASQPAPEKSQEKEVKIIAAVPQHKAVALYPFQAASESELNLDVGDEILVYSMESDDWWAGSVNGKVGHFPKAYVQLVEEKKVTTPGVVPAPTDTDKSSPIEVGRATALYDYSATSPSELSFSKGEEIIVLSIDSESGWWSGVINSKAGYFPKDYVKLKELPSVIESVSVIAEEVPIEGVPQTHQAEPIANVESEVVIALTPVVETIAEESVPQPVLESEEISVLPPPLDVAVSPLPLSLDELSLPPLSETELPPPLEVHQIPPPVSETETVVSSVEPVPNVEPTSLPHSTQEQVIENPPTLHTAQPETAPVNKVVLSESVAVTNPGSPLKVKKSPEHEKNPKVYIKCRALFPFEGKASGEISFKKGDDVFVTKKLEGAYWHGEAHGKSGTFPKAYVVPAPETTNATTPTPTPSQTQNKEETEAPTVITHDQENQKSVSLQTQTQTQTQPQQPDPPQESTTQVKPQHATEDSTHKVHEISTPVQHETPKEPSTVIVNTPPATKPQEKDSSNEEVTTQAYTAVKPEVVENQNHNEKNNTNNNVHTNHTHTPNNNVNNTNINLNPTPAILVATINSTNSPSSSPTPTHRPAPTKLKDSPAVNRNPNVARALPAPSIQWVPLSANQSPDLVKALNQMRDEISRLRTEVGIERKARNELELEVERLKKEKSPVQPERERSPTPEGVKVTLRPTGKVLI